MPRAKGVSIRQSTFKDKQFRLPDGREFEQVPIRECAIHHDDAILEGLAIRILVQAVQDWRKLNKKDRKHIVISEGSWVYRAEVLEFFNGSFCGEILDMLMPELTQEEALMNMNSMDFSHRQIGLGHGKLTDYGYNA